MKKYKFITIEPDGAGGFDILNNKKGDVIGWIDYHPQWKQYIFISQRNSIWSVDCLEDVINFIKKEIPK